VGGSEGTNGLRVGLFVFKPGEESKNVVRGERVRWRGGDMEGGETGEKEGRVRVLVAVAGSQKKMNAKVRLGRPWFVFGFSDHRGG